MTKNDQKQLGRTLWSIADDLRGSMNADDTRIAAQAAKLDALGARKRGLMQRLFPSPEEN